MPEYRSDQTYPTVNILLTHNANSAQVGSANIPTSDPGVAGADLYAYTSTSAAYPTITRQGKTWDFPTRQILGQIFVSGKMGASGTTIGWRMKKNGAQVATGTTASVTANYYYGFTCSFSNITLGDVLSVQLWCANNCTYDWYGYVLEPTQAVIQSGAMYKPFRFTDGLVTFPTAPSGRSITYTRERTRLGYYPTSATTQAYDYMTGDSASASTNVSLDTFYEYAGATSGSFRAYYGDIYYPNTVIFATASGASTLTINKFFTQIAYRQLKWVSDALP